MEELITEMSIVDLDMLYRGDKAILLQQPCLLGKPFIIQTDHKSRSG